MKTRVTIAASISLLALFVSAFRQVASAFVPMQSAAGQPSNHAGSIRKQQTGARTNDPLVVIHDSGATDFDASKTIRFSRNGSADITYQDGTTMFFRQASFTAPVQSVVQLVQRAGGPENIRTGQCFTSASFGHAVWLTIGGQQSGDLTCLASNARSIDHRVARITLKLMEQVVMMATARGVRDA